MLYQKILTDDMPYHLSVSSLYGYEDHRHADIEFQYVIRGSLDVVVDKTSYRVDQGGMSIIAPNVSHAFPSSDSADRLVLTGIVGTSFLKKYFAPFSSSSFSFKLIDLSEQIHDRADLKKTLDETAELYAEGVSDRTGLLLSSNIYRICAFLLSELEDHVEDGKDSLDLRAVADIEKALDLIYYDYKKDLTVDTAADITGYGKSNFCKIFKHITGTSFHRSLNKRRISVAKELLRETDMSVGAISDDVGFLEAKTFCRVFKEFEGITPGSYRKQFAKPK